MAVVTVRVSSPTLIGRGQELDRVAAALAEARDGHPAFLLVAGEAGVGKTRFLHEIADRVPQRRAPACSRAAVSRSARRDCRSDR